MTALKDKLVYVAGHYTKSPTHGTNEAVSCAEFLIRLGAVPFVPHLAMLWDAVAPHEPDFWYEYDMRILARCDAMVVIRDAEVDSYGVQMEVQYCIEHDIPIYRSDDLWEEEG